MDFQAPQQSSQAPSFLPKRSPYAPTQPSTAPVGIFMFIGVIVFLASAIAFGGVLLYTNNVQTNIDTSKAQLADVRKDFGNALNEISRFDLKLRTAQHLLNQHVSLLNLYADLEIATYQTVRFTSFKYGLADDGKIAVKMAGQARSYTDLNNYVPVALQSKKFAGIPNVKNVLFSDLNLDQTGNVVFNFSANLDPKFISYRENRLLQ
ncbi:MAG: hypothetical protein WC764_03745 [Candidatus Paceibacterota bacterium]|jgi:hypothetical protein